MTLLDDGKIDMGGFDDLPDMTADAEDDARSLETDADAEVDGEPAKKPEDPGNAPDKKNADAAADDADAAGDDDDAADDAPKPPDPMTEIRLMLAQQQEVINNLKAQIAARNQPQQPQEPTGEPDWPTEDDWAEDTGKAQRKLAAAIATQQRRTQAEEARQREQENTNRLQQAHNAMYSEVVKTPLGQHFQPGGKLRGLFESVFYNPEYGFHRNPSGVLHAAQHIDRMLRQQMAPAAPGAAPAPSQTPVQSPEAAVTEERKRQQRVRNAQMHGSGRGGGQAKVTLSRQEEALINQYGISKEAYLASKMARTGGAA